MKKIKITKIVDETTFIINVGLEDGIEEKDRFEILDAQGEEIKDPDNDEVIGVLNTSKGIIIADTVYPKMTIAKTRIIGGNVTLASDILRFSNPYLKETSGHPEELLVEESQISGGLKRSTNPIQIGDEVTKL
ncbi:hypothetical protein NE282_07790 [Leuconostoc mesenteroides]|uniref:hypothetical protein n=1 Tax=Leuconostoc mesenteroides TaxID=1245 RepID=UPI0020739C98|nr:hypothetical protein [Leuconostoc mesenteroides]MCM6833785.1 hypothetical protein [Leuconostoc mesenteroides]